MFSVCFTRSSNVLDNKRNLPSELTHADGNASVNIRGDDYQQGTDALLTMSKYIYDLSKLKLGNLQATERPELKQG